MQIIYKFHLKELFEKLMTATFISLITKKANAKELKGLRHIILIEGTYKLISKFLIIELILSWENWWTRINDLFERETNNGCITCVK